jgi:hypothetical protein
MIRERATGYSGISRDPDLPSRAPVLASMRGMSREIDDGPYGAMHSPTAFGKLMPEIKITWSKR